MNSIDIAISGKSGSGKTLVADQIIKVFESSGWACVFSDTYISDAERKHQSAKNEKVAFITESWA